MASNKNRGAAATDENTENAETVAPIEGETPLEGMPEPDAEADDEEDGKVKRTPVPPGLRPLFNEIGRLSGFLSLARRSVYENNPERAVKALALLERSVPDAREIAELSVS